MAGHSVPFSLVTPTGAAFSGEAELVIAVGSEGEVGILPGHAPFVTALRPGILRANIREENGGTRRLEIATSDGFLQALPGEITVLVSAAMERAAVDPSAARADLAAAQERQKATGGDAVAWRREQNAIDFAEARLHIAGATP